MAKFKEAMMNGGTGDGLAEVNALRASRGGVGANPLTPLASLTAAFAAKISSVASFCTYSTVYARNVNVPIRTGVPAPVCTETK